MDVELELVWLVLLLELVVLLVDDVAEDVFVDVDPLEVDVLLLEEELVKDDVVTCPVVLLDVPVVKVVEDGDVVLDDETLGWLAAMSATLLTDATTMMARIA